MGDTPDPRQVQAAGQAACAEATRIRANITRIQAEAARNGSALMRRSLPGDSRLKSFRNYVLTIRRSRLVRLANDP